MESSHALQHRSAFSYYLNGKNHEHQRHMSQVDDHTKASNYDDGRHCPHFQRLIFLFLQLQKLVTSTHGQLSFYLSKGTAKHLPRFNTAQGRNAPSFEATY